MKKLRNNYPDIYPAGPTYIRGIKSGNTLYISGITANNSNAQYKDIMSQLDVILDRITKIVHSEGGESSDIVSMTTYIVESEMPKFWPINDQQQQIWTKYFKGEWPTNSYIGIPCLATPEMKIEITATTILD